jgi:hypothetical protein
MSSDVAGTISTMREQLDVPASEMRERVCAFSPSDLEDALSALHLVTDDFTEVVAQWEITQRDEEWVTLLAAVLTTIERQRGHVDEPIGIWSDLDDAGPSGRFFYVYLFALAYEGTLKYLAENGVPRDVIDSTFSVVATQAATHRRKWGSAGTEAGWFTIPILRGELLQIGSLHFHQVNLGVGTLSPSPWYDEVDAQVLGVGFRHGEPSIGLHIPRGTDLSPDAIDSTMARARDVLGVMWPTRQRRLATCGSWMLDQQLREFLPSTSNLMLFQDRFAMVPTSSIGDEEALDFVYERPGVPLEQLPQQTSLQRAIVSVLARGEHWRNQAGWFVFDGDQ